MIGIIPAVSDEQLKTVERLAWEILHEHYDSYIDPVHVEYFLLEYQTVSALKAKVNKGIHYFLITKAQQPAGYLAFQHFPDTTRISKLYIHQQFRANKLGKIALNFAIDKAIEHGSKKVDLFVSKDNAYAIRFYESGGFEIKELVVHAYRNEHSEEDYRMERALN